MCPEVLFVIGTLVGPVIVMLVMGRGIDMTPVASALMLPIAGFIVGLGTAIGSGCTSGHVMRTGAAVSAFNECGWHLHGDGDHHRLHYPSHRLRRD